MTIYKVIIRITGGVVLLVCMVMLSFVLVVDICEKRADAYAESSVNQVAPAGLSGPELSAFKDSIKYLKWERRGDFIDSVADLPFTNIGFLKRIYTYRYCRDHALMPKGRVKGGLKMVVAIAPEDFLRGKSGINADAGFNEAIAEAQKLNADSGGDFFASFQQAFEKQNPDGKLADVFCRTDAYLGKINCTAANDEVINRLKADLDTESMGDFTVLRTRINRFGATEPHMIRTPKTGQIAIDLPGIDNPQRVRKLLLRPAHLQFFNTYETAEVITYLSDANTALRKMHLSVPAVKDATPTTALKPKHDAVAELLDSTGGNNVDTAAYLPPAPEPVAAKEDNPLFALMYPNITGDGRAGEGPLVARAFGKDTARINQYLSFKEIKALFPRDLKLLWGVNGIHASASGTVYGLYAIKFDPLRAEAPVSGDDVTDAYKSFDQFGTPQVDIAMNQLAAANWERMTDAAANAMINGKAAHRCVAIVMDDRVFSAPRVMQKISGGRSQITGIEDISEAEDLATVLQSGRLQDNLRVLEYHFTAPEGPQAGNLWVLLLAGLVLVGIFVMLWRSTR